MLHAIGSTVNAKFKTHGFFEAQVLAYDVTNGTYDVSGGEDKGESCCRYLHRVVSNH